MTLHDDIAAARSIGLTRAQLRYLRAVREATADGLPTTHRAIAAMLACVEEGLGCTLTTLHCLHEDEVKAALDIPDGWATAAMVPIGYPVGRGHGPITRQPPSVLAFRDRFGTAW